jgi:hypothetical protein
MLIIWSNIFLKTVLFFSSISFGNAAQDMRIREGELAKNFGGFLL